MLAGPMRFAVLITNLGGGGAEHQAQMVVEHMATSGHDAAVLTLLDLPPGAFERAVPTSVQRRHIGLRRRGLPWALLRVNGWMRAWKPDVVLAMNEPAVLAARLTCPWSLPLVSSVRTSALPKGLRLGLLKSTRLRDSATVFNSRTALSRYAEAGVAAASRSRLIPNAVGYVGRYVPPGSVDAFRWVAVGRLTPAKGFDVLLEALGILSGDRRSSLDIYGDGPDRTSLGALARDLGVEDLVTFRGYVEGWKERLSDYDGFVLSSRWEGSPNAALEAIATGIPAVVTDVGDLRSVAAPERVSKTADARSLAATMRNLVQEDEAVREQRSATARERVLAAHSPSHVMGQWEDLLVASARHRSS